jgi:GNAT superfamily N-acetyltransferase
MDLPASDAKPHGRHVRSLRHHPDRTARGRRPRSSACTERTFGPGRYARTAYRIREQLGHRLDLSYTARIGTLLVGSVRLTPVRIGETPALLLGPLTVEPPFRDRGIAKALMERALVEAKQKGTGWSCWSATSPITSGSASSARRAAGEARRSGRSGAHPLCELAEGASRTWPA